MNRAEAEAMLHEYDDHVHDYYSLARRFAGLASKQGEITNAFHKMNSLRERLLDHLCGEEHTEPLVGRVT